MAAALVEGRESVCRWAGARGGSCRTRLRPLPWVDVLRIAQCGAQPPRATGQQMRSPGRSGSSRPREDGRQRRFCLRRGISRTEAPRGGWEKALLASAVGPWSCSLRPSPRVRGQRVRSSLLGALLGRAPWCWRRQEELTERPNSPPGLHCLFQ